MTKVIHFHPPRFLDLREFIDGGFMQEPNRRFFHVLGLELVAQLQDDGSLMLKVCYSRNLDGGVVYPAPDDDEVARRLQRNAGEIDRLWRECARAREARYGFVIQPVGQF